MKRKNYAPLSNIPFKEQFLVIGLVGAVGSSLKTLSNVLKSIFNDDFNYSVEEFSISKHFLRKELLNTGQTPLKDIPNLWMRVIVLERNMTIDIYLIKVIEYIANARSNSNEKRIVYII